MQNILNCNVSQSSEEQFSMVKVSAVHGCLVQYSEVQCTTMQYSAVLYSAVTCSVVQYSSVQSITVQCSAVQYSAVQCNTFQYRIVECSLKLGKPERRPTAWSRTVIHTRILMSNVAPTH